MSMEWLKKIFQIQLFSGIVLKPYSQIPAQMISGIVLAVIAIPEVMSYAKLAGIPVVYGLYSLLFPLLTYSLLASSRRMVAGLDSTTILILSTSLLGFAVRGSEQWVLLISFITIIVGVTLFFLSLFRLSFIANFISTSTLAGFISGVGLYLAIRELLGIFGVHTNQETLQAVFYAAYKSFQHFQINSVEVILSLSLIAMMLIGRRLLKSMPWFLIAVIVSIIISWHFHLNTVLHTVGNLQMGLPHLTNFKALPINLDMFFALIPIIATVVFVIIAQSIATAEATAEKHQDTLNPVQTLKALALTNLVSGLTNGAVIVGSVTKTAILDERKYASQLSNLTAVIVVAVVLLFFISALAYLPECTLSSIIFVLGLIMFDFKKLRAIFSYSRLEFTVVFITMLSILFVGISFGLIVSIILALLKHIQSEYMIKNVVLSENKTMMFSNEPNALVQQYRPGVFVYVPEIIYFASIKEVVREITEAVRLNPSLKKIYISLARVHNLDYSAIEGLLRLNNILKQQNIELYFYDLQPNLANKAEFPKVQQLFPKQIFSASLEALVP